MTITPTTDMAREQSGDYLVAVEELEHSHADLLDALRAIDLSDDAILDAVEPGELVIVRRSVEVWKQARAAIKAAEGRRE